MLSCSICAAPMKSRKKSLPQGKATCHPCRRIQRAAGPAPLRPARPVKTDTCGVCRVEYTVARRGPKRRRGTCARHRYHWLTTCVCGTEFWRRRGCKPYCSPECHPVIGSCEQCGNEMRGHKRRFCSQPCRAEHTRLSNLKPKVNWHCNVCDELVIRDSGPVGMYCKVHKNSMRNPRRAANVRKREALKRGADSGDVINAMEIFERDRWRCGLCQRHVDKRLKYPHPKSASLDHIEPLSREGKHIKTNVQCAHLDCNVRKGNREHAQQLMLIG